MNAGVVLPERNWVELDSGALELRGEHAYWQIRKNIITGKWALGRRLGDPHLPIRLMGFYETVEEAKAAAEAREASL